MASALHKRLAKLEEALASKLNQPLAYVWINDGETREDAIVRAGYSLDQAHRIKTIRWLTSEEAAAAAPLPWDVPDPGPPPDGPGVEAASTLAPEPRSEVGRQDRPSRVQPKFDEEAESRYRLAIEERERE